MLLEILTQITGLWHTNTS